MHNHTDIFNHLWDVPHTSVRERLYGRIHDIYDGAPNEWAAERGATHTLWTGIGLGRGSRPAILKNTVLCVAIDESDDQITWGKWDIKHIS